MPTNNDTIHEPTPTLLLLSLSSQALAGIDLLSFTTSPRFRGISNLPTNPSLHFAFAAASTSLSGRWGIWFPTFSSSASSSSHDSSTAVAAQQGESLTVLKWDEGDEVLVAEDDATELMRWRANLGKVVMEGGLVGYTQSKESSSSAQSKGRIFEVQDDDDEAGAADALPQKQRGVDKIEGDSVDWTTLTTHVTSAVLDRILGRAGGNEAPATDFGSSTWRLSSMSSSLSDREEIARLNLVSFATNDASAGISTNQEQQNQQQPSNLRSGQNQALINDDHDKPLNLLPINLRQTWAPGTLGRARTTAARDRSWALTSLLSTHCTSDPSHVLGELQFTFLMLLTLNNVSCAEQWQKLLKLLLTCVKAVEAMPGFFVQALRCLKAQLEFVGRDANAEVVALLDLVDETSELKDLLQRFRNGVEGLDVSADGHGDTMQDDAGGEKGVLYVKKELDALETFLAEERGWQFGGTFAKQGMLVLEDGEEVRMETTAFDEDDEEGEFAPVVVDLTEEQAKSMGIDRGEGGSRVDRKLGSGRSQLEQEILQQQTRAEEEGEETDEEKASDDDPGSSEVEVEMGDMEDMDARY